MMHLQKLQVYNFKNYEQVLYQFSEGLNCIVGPNGAGKTNILDAIYFLAFTKSAFHSQDLQSIRFGEEYFKIDGIFKDNESEEQISVMVPQLGKKLISSQQTPYDRIIDHIGKYPAVFFLPEDTDLIRDSAETRRKLFDGILGTANIQYLEKLMQYKKIVEQRNQALKKSENPDYTLLEIYAQQLFLLGTYIFNERQKLLATLLPSFIDFYNFLSEEAEPVDIAYQSTLSSMTYDEMYTQTLQYDLAAQRTTQGVHKDDFLFSLKEKNLKKFGSQGQKKSFVLAIKLAQFKFLSDFYNKKPLVLMDDIFDKLDDVRIKKIVEKIGSGFFGQVFITDARMSRTEEIFSGVEKKIFNISR